MATLTHRDQRQNLPGNCLRRWTVRCIHERFGDIYELEKDHPVLKDYVVTIPPGGKTDALVECAITWEFKGKTIKTRGLDSDQTVAAIKGTIRMLKYYRIDK
jgi:hypothetical protein